MPSRDGLLNHLHDPAGGHLLRIRIIVQMMGAENGAASDYIETLPFSGLARLHGDFHRLDAEDAGLVNSQVSGPMGSREDAAVGPQEGGQ